MPGITGPLYDETYDLGVQGGTTYELGFVDVAPFILAVSPPIFILITTPLIIFIGPSSHVAMAATIDILTWEGVAAHAEGVSASRAFIWEGVSAHTAAASTIDILTWEGVAAHAAGSSLARGGG